MNEVSRIERRMGAPRKPTKNTDDPRGQFGIFLRHWLDSKADRREAKKRIADAAEVDQQAVGKWEQGESGPPLKALDAVAVAMGYKDWAKLAIAVVKFSRDA